MKRSILVVAIILSVANVASADIFDEGGANEFTIDFVNISGDASSANGTYIGASRPEGFTDPANDYRMGTYEITYDQWDKFVNSYGTVTGSDGFINPGDAYNSSPHFTGTNVPTNMISWYEAAQFINYLNTSTDHTAAYKFTGTQGTGDYALGVWESGDAGYDSTNPYRNSNAYYFMPTEDEWVKAAYWNGTSLQTYASVGNLTPTQSGWNFYDGEFATDPSGPWDVGSGSEELNGTFDMMGNVFELMESPFSSGDYLSGSGRIFRGGSFSGNDFGLSSSYRGYGDPYVEFTTGGFRVASVPEPCSLVLLSLGGLMLRRRRAL